jgi:hypothetical protein
VKLRQIRSLGDGEDEGLFHPLGGSEIFDQLASQQSRVRADNVVLAGVIVGRAAEDLDPDLLLGDLVGLIEQGAAGDVNQEAAQALGAKQYRAGYDSLDQLPARMFR